MIEAVLSALPAQVDAINDCTGAILSFEHNDDSVADTNDDDNAIKITMKCSLCMATLQQKSGGDLHKGKRKKRRTTILQLLNDLSACKKHSPITSEPLSSSYWR